MEALKPLGGHAVLVFLLQLALLLLVARVGAEAVRRLGLPAVVGELFAGIALGRSGLGHFFPNVFTTIFPQQAAQFHLLEVIGTLGMVLLLLLTGLETDLRLLRNLGRAALIASVLGMALPFATGFGLGVFMPEAYVAQPDHRILFSFFLATSMAISAMPVIAKILLDLDLTRRNIGVIILSAGVVDDTAGWLILSVIAGAASQGQVNVASLLLTIGLTAAFLVASLVVVFPFARTVMGFVRRRFQTEGSDLVFMLVLTFIAAAATEAIGIHAVFGAFVIGTLFRQVPSLSDDVVHRLESFVFSVLAPIFFGIVGLKVDLWRLGGGGGTMLAIVLTIACLGKLVGCTVGSLWGGLRFWEGLSIAVAMNARGAMELIVATIGLSLGILNEQMFSIIVMVAIVTSFMAPIGLRLTMRKVRMTEEEQQRMLADRNKGLFEPTRVRVLLPTAGGPNGGAAALVAAGIARRSEHPVEVVSVRARASLRDRLFHMFTPKARGVPSSDETAIARQLVAADLAPTFRELKGEDVAAAIVEEARRGFEFIVVGASSRAGWLGSDVLETVVREAPCHLAVVKADARAAPDHAAATKLGKVLVSYDGGVLARVAVEFAARFAEATGAELTIALISEATPNREPLADSDTLNRISPVLSAMANLRPKLLRFTQTPLGSPFVTEAASGAYDLIVVGTENRAVQSRLFFGRESEQLLAAAKGALVFVVPNVALLR